jgi:hypothetical protein
MDSTPDARDVLLRFVRARSDDGVVFARDLDQALDLLTGCVADGVVVFDPCADLDASDTSGTRIVGAQVDIASTLASVEAELRAQPARLLIVPGVAGHTGEVLPLPRFAAVAHRHGARLVVDAGELATRRIINLTSHGIDYVVLSGRKVAGFGPTAVIGRADWLPPNDSTLVDATVAQGFAEACAAVADLGFDWIGLHEEALSAVVDDAVARLPGARRLRLWPDLPDRVGLAALAVAGRFEPILIRWDLGTGQKELARQLDALAHVVFEQETS